MRGQNQPLVSEKDEVPFQCFVNWRKQFSLHHMFPEEILVFGGYSKTPENCFGYSVANSKWVTIPAQMNALRRTPAGAMSSEGVVVAGSAIKLPQNSAELYLAKDRRWVSIAGLKVNRFFHTAASDERGRVFCLGGQSGDRQFVRQVARSDRVFRSIEAYDPVEDEWQISGCMREARQCFASVSQATSIISCGGFGSTGVAVSTCERFDPRAGPCGFALAPMPHALATHTATPLLPWSMLVCGGLSGGRATSLAWEYDVRADRWLELPAMRQARNAHCAAAVDGRVHVIGGVAGTQTPMEVFDSEQRQWEEGPALPSTRMMCAAVAMR